MRIICAILVVGTAFTAWAQYPWRVKRVAYIESGMTGESQVPLGDTDHDGLAEITFWRHSDSTRLWRWETWEYRPVNRYALVKAESCTGNPNPPEGINKGTFLPAMIGDADEDGLSEVLGVNQEMFYTGGQFDSLHTLVCIYESPSDSQLPDTLVWTYQYPLNPPWPLAWYTGDLDRDGIQDFIFSDMCWTYFFENSGDNQYDLVWKSARRDAGAAYAFGDFDQDSAMDYAYSDSHYDGFTFIFECAGNDSFVLVDSVQHSWPAGYDVFSGDDLDQDGKPEFYVVYHRFDPVSCFFLCMYEATGDNTYEQTFVDSIIGGGMLTDASNSDAGDVDGDGIEELCISYNGGFRIYKATGNNQFECMAQRDLSDEAHVQAYDMNRNGYADIIVSGTGHVWDYELDAIRLISPNGGDSLLPGETCHVAWHLYPVPRCDSVGLFLRTDSAWVLDTIATGIPPSDSTYDWIVPSGPLDSCRLVAIAFGPGWLYDESDRTFRISAGVSGAGPVKVHDWSLSVGPSPATGLTRVCYDVPRDTDVTVDLLDAVGRVLGTLSSGRHKAGRYVVHLHRADVTSGPDVATRAGRQTLSGVYFVRLVSAGFTAARKVVLAR